MNQTDARKLTDAIEALTRQLRSGGSSPSSPSSQPAAPTSTSTPGQLDALSYIEEQNKEYEKQLKIIQMVNDAAALGEQQQNDLIEELNEKRRTAVGLSEEEEELRQRLRELQIVGNTVMEDNLKLQEDANKAIAKNNEGLDNQKKKQEELLKIEERKKELAKDQAQLGEDIAKSIGSLIGLRDKPGGMTGLLSNIIAGGKDGRKAAFGGLAKGFKSLMNPVSLVSMGIGGFTRILQAAVEAIIYFVLKFDALGASIAKTTGHGREFAEQTINLASNTRGATATIETMTPAVVSLGNQLKNVNGISYETAASFAAVAVSAERMGVSVEETGLFMKDAMVGGGMSAEEAEQAFSNLNKAAELMGRNFSELSGEFMSSRATFAAYGQNMQKVFLRTSSVARQMGVELGTVLGMSDKFKTFEDSAGFVAEFNHMVGASLDPLEMMRLRAEEGPEAVAMALKDSIGMAGKSFDELSFAMREGIADSLGIPMNELRNMMESDVDLGLVDDIENAAQPVDTLIEKGNATLTVLERIGSMLMQVADQFAIAFGFDQFAGKGLSGLLNEMQKFISNDLRDTIMNDFVPFMKVDMPSIVSGVKSFMKGLLESPVLNALFDFDEIQAKAKAEQAMKAKEEAMTLGSILDIRNEEKRMKALKGAGYNIVTENATEDDIKNNKKELQRIKQQMERYSQQAGHLIRESKQLNDLDDLDTTEVLAVMASLEAAPATYSAIKLNKMEASAQNQYESLAGASQASMDRKKLQEAAKARAPNLMGTGGFLRDGIAYVHQGEMIVPEMFARNGSPYSNPANTQPPPETKVAVSINVDDRKLRDLFNVTVEKVIEGA